MAILMQESISQYSAGSATAFPSSNSNDNGNLTLEENLTGIVNRITDLNYALTEDSFVMTEITMSDGSKGIRISAGSANINGYEITTSSSIDISHPSTLTGDNIFLVLRTAYDSSDHILGTDGMATNSYYQGVYGTWMLSTDPDLNNGSILVIGSVSWDGSSFSNIVRNPTIMYRINPTLVMAGDKISLKDLIDSLPDSYVKRAGDTMYGSLVFNDYDSVDTTTYGIAMNYNPDKSGDSNITVRSKRTNFTNPNTNLAVIGIDSNSPYISLGSAKININAGMLDLSGLPVAVSDDFDVIGNSLLSGILKTSTDSITFVGPIPELQTNITYGIDPDNSSNFASMKIGTSDDNFEIQRNYENATVEFNLKTKTSSTPVLMFNSNCSFDKYIYPNMLSWDNGSFMNDSSWILNSNSANGVSTISMSSAGIQETSRDPMVVSLLNSSNGNGSNLSLSNSGTISLYSIVGAASIKFSGLAANNTATIYHNPNDAALNVTADSLNVSGTITATKVFNAIYNDYAEWYAKDDNCTAVAGDVIVLNPETGKYTKCASSNSKFVVGVFSDSYGHILGGEILSDMEKNSEKYIPVGISGRIFVKASADVVPGDLLVSSNDGTACSCRNPGTGTILGKALSYSNNGKVLMQIMLG
jgi:hypothetical protein